jgi:hypothetical protein
MEKIRRTAPLGAGVIEISEFSFLGAQTLTNWLLSNTSFAHRVKSVPLTDWLIRGRPVWCIHFGYKFSKMFG